MGTQQITARMTYVVSERPRGPVTINPAGDDGRYQVTFGQASLFVTVENWRALNAAMEAAFAEAGE